MLGQKNSDVEPLAMLSAEPSPSAEHPSRLLIIEDALIHSTIISRIAEKNGFTAMIAHSYEEACKLLHEWRFDCITLDLGLGKRAGVEVLNQLSKIEYKMPIIIISGSEKSVCDETVQIGKSLQLNICEPVPKPIDLKALRETLAQIAMQSRLRHLASQPA
jgi:DNA-binding NtrC family response regulator